MSSNESNSSTPTPSETKLCHIVKRPDFDGYGFNLHSEKIKPGQFIGKVDANSPALLAGLKEGDRIIEVNGVPIGSETHKQVVQRIKAISNEVRLLLIDVDGATQKGAPDKADAVDAVTATKDAANNVTATKDVANTNNNAEEYHGSVQEMPGASANISTISMISTKRMSNSSSNGSQTSTATAVPVLTPVVPPVVPPMGDDVTDRGYKKNGTGTNGDVAVSTIEPHTKLQQSNNSITNNNNNSNNNNVITPLPPSAAVASPPQQAAPATPTLSGNGNKAGSLQLPMTAAEMRAKLMSKKKYDPKNESVDLKKKFEIIQKL